MANEVIGIEVQVKLEQLRSQLATLGPGMEKEAKAMTAALNREIKQQTAAMKAAAKATSQVRTDSIKDVAVATEAAGTKFDKLAKAAGPLGGVLARISPEAGAVASSLAGLTGAAEGVAAGLGTSMAGGVAALSAVIGPAVIALGLLTANMQYEAAQAEASKAAHKSLNEALQFTKQLADGTADAMLDLKVKVGQLAPEEVAYQKAVKEVTDASDAQHAKIEGWIAERKALGGAWGAEVKMLREAQEGLKANTDERLLVIAADKEWAAEVRKSAEYIAERDKKAAAGVAAAADASRKAADLAQETADKEAEQAAESDAIAARATERDLSRMSDMDAHRAKSARRQMELAAEVRDNELQAIEDVARAERESRESAIATASSLGDLASSAADALGQYAETVGKKNKKAARDAFAVGKVVAMSSALVNTAIAVTNALATVPYPAAPIAAAAAAVSGGVQLAAIAAEKPSFHRGGMVEEQARGEVSATLLPGESVLNRQATSALGAGGVAALNNGGGGGGSVSLRIGRLEAREIIRTDVASGGLVVQAARSAAAKGGNLAGRSGRRPIG